MMQTLYDKVWRAHTVLNDGDASLLYVDRHLLHEGSSPQAFAGLRNRGLAVRKPALTLALSDHNPPSDRDARLRNQYVNRDAERQVQTLAENSRTFGITCFLPSDSRQGITHVVGPENGLTLPGMVVVCGDSHTATHGAFGAIGFGIGTSEVEHVLATQTIWQRRLKNMRVVVTGSLGCGVYAKDLILAVIGKIGTAGAAGHAIEYVGSAISALSMEARMTVCNLSIEAGARVGLIAPDQTTFDYLRERASAPAGAEWDRQLAQWRELASDADAPFDREVELPGDEIEPQVTWGTSPEHVAAITECIPDPADQLTEAKQIACARALEYMGLQPGTPIRNIAVNRVFIGSCANGRIEDLREAAELLRDQRIAKGVALLVVPGSQAVKRQAEREGLREVIESAGGRWGEAGCSMCVAQNGDALASGERCASTSSRNFEGRQGRGGRTHLVSPAMAAAAAVAGHFIDVRDILE